MKYFSFFTVLMLVATVSAAPPRKLVRKEMGKLQGQWELVSSKEDGKPITGRETEMTKLLFRGKRYSYVKGRESRQGQYAIDPTRSPKAMNIRPFNAINSDSTQRTNLYQCIYKLEEDELTICLALPGRKRPTDFESKPGTGVSIQVWKRVNETARRK